MDEVHACVSPVGRACASLRVCARLSALEKRAQGRLALLGACVRATRGWVGAVESNPIQEIAAIRNFDSSACLIPQAFLPLCCFSDACLPGLTLLLRRSFRPKKLLIAPPQRSNAFQCYPVGTAPTVLLQ